MPPVAAHVRRAGHGVSTDSVDHRLSETTAVRFERGADRCSVRLLFGRGGAGPDVSVQPAAVDRVLADQARLAGIDPNRMRRDLVETVIAWDASFDWVGRDAGGVLALVGAFAHPVLAPLYRDGRSPVDEIPRWASPVLRCPDARSAAERLAGGRGSRRLVRSLAGSLSSIDGEVHLSALGPAVAAAGLVNDDVLANLLDTTAAAGAQPVLSVREVDTIRTGLGWFPADRRGELLLGVARDGRAAQLAATLTRLRWVIDAAPRPLPIRLDRLTALADDLVPVLAPPAPRPAPGPGTGEPGTGRGAGRGPARRRGDHLDPWADVPHPAETIDAQPVRQLPQRRREPNGRRNERPANVPQPPPRTPSTSVVASNWPVPPELEGVHEHRVGDLVLVVPTSAAELRLWSRQLGNCLDTYPAAVGQGRSWVIGVTRRGAVVGAVEIEPQARRLRQASGPRNRALAAGVYEPVIGALRRSGVLR